MGISKWISRQSPEGTTEGFLHHQSDSWGNLQGGSWWNCMIDSWGSLPKDSISRGVPEGITGVSIGILRGIFEEISIDILMGIPKGNLKQGFFIPSHEFGVIQVWEISRAVPSVFSREISAGISKEIPEEIFRYIPKQISCRITENSGIHSPYSEKFLVKPTKRFLTEYRKWFLWKSTIFKKSPVRFLK